MLFFSNLSPDDRLRGDIRETGERFSKELPDRFFDTTMARYYKD